MADEVEKPRAYRFGCRAMGTRFGVTLVCHDATRASEMAQIAFDEVRRLEHELSRFVPASDVSRIRALRSGESLRIGVATYECFRTAQELHAETGGAFDVTIGPLREVWVDDSGRLLSPGPEDVAAARGRCGPQAIELHADENAVTALADGPCIDLGGIGKGYAVDAVADLLAEWKPAGALIHGGESTVRALGRPLEGEWTAALRKPGTDEPLGEMRLGERALSGSGTLEHGPHIIDPRTARPEVRHEAAWALAGTAALADALSTAFMVMDAREVEEYCGSHSEVSATLLHHGSILHFGN